ncbi:MAG: TetR/AcrR family transcriptional regulator [Coriobacteriales bacterium]|jgi:AcrR family transcriptional regulator|nr:TetR/AcrR family transcriptional regulator [Coriobacteriales bacterium]
MRITKPVEVRRQEIVKAARELFISRGFGDTNVADISSKIHVAQGLIYHYFDSKLDILYAVVDQLVAEQIEQARRQIEKHPGTAKESVKELLSGEIQHKALGKLLPTLIADKGIMEYAQKQMSHSLVPFFEDLIKRGNKDGSWDCQYPKETAIVILQGVSGLVDYDTLDDDIKNKTVKQDVVNDIVTRLLGVP